MGLGVISKKRASKCLVSLIALCVGCSFREGRERVTVPSLIALPGIGVASINHEVYETDDQKRIEYAINTDISTTAFGGQVDVSVYGRDRKFLWMYKTHAAKHNLNMDIYNSNRKKIKSLNEAPLTLPTAVYFSNTDWIHYLNCEGSFVDPEDLVEMNPYSLDND